MKELYINIPYSEPSIHILSEDANLIKHLYYNFTPFATLIKANEEKREKKIYIDNLTAGYNIAFNKEVIYASCTDVLLKVLGRIINLTIATKSPFIGIHGAILSNKKANFLFVGATGVGKSTLSAYLAKMGFEYYSDDKCLIDCNSRYLVPFYKPIYLREPALGFLNGQYQLGIYGKVHIFGEETRLIYDVPQFEVDNSKKLNIIFLERNCNTELEINRLSSREALNEILNHLIYVGNLVGSVKDAFRLMSGTPCFRLKYCDLEEVAVELNSIRFKNV